MLALLLAAAFGGLGYRLVDLQVLRHDELSAKAQQNTQHELLLVPRRGDILDAKGNLLATSVFVKTVCADPVLMGNRKAEIAHASVKGIYRSIGAIKFGDLEKSFTLDRKIKGATGRL